ncbi:TPA: fimbria/pilus periplasmic chaperone [Escherichia coli]|nr:fimbria/pilus periplasmic chaperone [Escherichia coli]
MKKLFLLMIAGLFSLSSHAGVVIMGTRIIYPENQKSVNVQINNDESSPSLIQSWIDTGDASAAPDSVKVPFIITPPVFRVEPHSGQTLRIMYTGEILPADRESVFWLNVLDIPAKPKFENKDNLNTNYLQLAVRSRIKLFYRPEKLAASPQDAHNLVTWHIEKSGAGTFLRAENKSPYFITYNHIALNQSNKSIPVSQPGMVAPYSSERFPVNNRLTGTGEVKWTIVNDYGGYEQGQSVLN